MIDWKIRRKGVDVYHVVSSMTGLPICTNTALRRGTALLPKLTL